MKTGFMGYLRLTGSDVETDPLTRHHNPLSVYSTIFGWRKYHQMEMDTKLRVNRIIQVVDLLRSSVEGVKVAEFEPDPLSFLSGEFVGAG